MAESLKSRIKRIAFNYFPAVWASGGRYTYAADDMRELHLRLSLNLRSRNFVGTIFGGSMFSATDPMFFMMLIKNLPGYIIWDKSSKIRFKKPGRDTLYVKTRITQEDIDSIVEELKTKEKTDRVFSLDLIDEAGDVCATIEKTIHIRHKHKNYNN
jgi:acyl-coenzyme A thioesterase PaaI-like protein